MNTLEWIRPRHAKAIEETGKIDKFFSHSDNEKLEPVKLNMQKQYEKHKSVMDLLAVFESHTSSKSLQFSKQFGVDQIHDVQILEEESEEDLPRTTEAIISGESVDNYKFCESNIPLKLNPQEYTIYSSVEILLKKTMRNKRHQLDHQKVLDKFEEISLVIRQLVEYFLQK